MKISDEKKDDLEANGKNAPSKRSRLPFIAALIVANVVVLLVLVLLVTIRQSNISPPAVGSDSQVVDPLHVVVRADTLLLSGKPKEAIEQYKRVSKNNKMSSAIAYRLAVGSEAMGDLTESLRNYELANNHDFSETSLAAQLGEVRIYYKLRKFDAALNAIAPLSSVSALPVLSSTSIGQQTRYMLAFALSAKAQQATHSTSVLDTKHIFRETIELSTEEALKLVPMEGNQIGLPTPIGDDTRIGIKVYGEPREPKTTLMSCGIKNQPAVVVLELLAKETGWQVSLTPIANEVLSAKRVEIQLRDVTAAELLSLVLESQGLFWSYEGDALVIDQVEQFPHELVDTMRRSRATTLLLGALAEAPSHKLAPHAYLALGNLAAISNRRDQAVTFYKDARQRYPRHPATQLANMNLAKVWLANGNPTQAEEMLYEVVDSRGTKTLASLAFLFLGQIHLEMEQLEKAKRELSRCLGVASQPDIAATAAMTLASIYLLSRDESSCRIANSVLMDHRDALRDPRRVENAIFLSALTRFRVAIRPEEVRRRGRELLASTVKVKPETFFGFQGYLLVGDAFSELSIGEEATRVYQDGLQQQIPDSMRNILMYRLASEYRNQNKIQPAKATLSELFATESSGMAPIAAIDLAKMLLQEGSIQPCIEHCRVALSRDFADESVGQLLKTLGRAYEEQGNHEQASLCFGGFLPNSTTLQTVDATQ